MSSRASNVWVLSLFPLMAAFFIIITSLTQTSLWSDEGWTIAATHDPNPITVIRDWAIQDVHPPLYFIWLGIWRGFTGETIFEMRYFSLLMTLLGVAMMVRIGTEMFNRRTGLIAATFYALHDQVKVMTQEVRHYPGQMTMTIVVLWLYWRFQQKPTRQRGIAFIIGGVVGLYVHYWIAFILLACGLHALIVHLRNRNTLYRVIGAGIVIAGLFALWIPALIRQITLERPQGLPHALENTNYVYRVLLYQLIGTPEVLWLVLMAVGLIGSWVFVPRRWWPSSASSLLFFAVIVPPALTLLMNAFYPILSFRALAVIVPPAALLAAYGLSRFRTPEGHILLLFIVFFSLTNTAAGAIFRPDWPSIVETASTHSTASDVLLLENEMDSYVVTYYIQQSGRNTATYNSTHMRVFEADIYPSFMEDALTDANGVWVSMLNWPDLVYDIRAELSRHGFQQTAPELHYGLYNDRPNMLWRFDRLPDGEPIATFADELALHRAEATLNQDIITVNLLWEAEATPTQEYTVSILLFGPAGISNQDNRPFEGLSPTSTWTAGELYFDGHRIDATSLPSGEYRIAVQVYWFTDSNFTQTQNALTDVCIDDRECRFVFIGQVTIP